MEIKHRILEFDSDKAALLRVALDRIGVPYEVVVLGFIGGIEQTFLECMISENDPLVNHVVKLIQELELYVQTGLYYSYEDIENAEWLWVTAGAFQYPQPEDTYIERTFDSSVHCPFCGIGRVQNAPFRLRSDFKQRRAHFLGLHWVHDEIFVRPIVKELFQANRVSGTDFEHPVHHKKNQQIETVYQMRIEILASPTMIVEGLQPVTCKENNEEGLNVRRAGVQGQGISRYFDEYEYCGRVKYHFPRTETFKLKRDDVRRLPDVVKSWEYFGSGLVASHLIMVRKRIYALFKQQKWRGLKFTPIELV